MAKKVVLVDDLDGESSADETVVYGLDGEFFEIDLSGDNARKLRELLAPYVDVSRGIAAKEAARRTSTSVTAGGSSSASPGGGVTGGVGASPGPNGQSAAPDPAVVRTWAQANGIEVGEKGRIPEAVVQKWRQANVEGAAPDESAPSAGGGGGAATNGKAGVPAASVSASAGSEADKAQAKGTAKEPVAAAS